MSAGSVGSRVEPADGTWHERPTQAIGAAIARRLALANSPDGVAMVVAALRVAISEVDAATWHRAWQIWGPQAVPPEAVQRRPENTPRAGPPEPAELDDLLGDAARAGYEHVARQIAFGEAADGYGEVPPYAVTTGPEGEFVVLMPAGLDGVGRARVAGDCRRRFLPGQGGDRFAGLRVPWPVDGTYETALAARRGGPAQGGPR